MYLHYTDVDGKDMRYELGEEQITIGRSEDANLRIDDVEISRFHAAIILWDGDYVIKDLNTPNGTIVNGQKVAVAMLYPGSVIGVGSHEIILEEKSITVGKGPNTVIRKVSREMDDGKGYKTIMKEIIRDVETREKLRKKPHEDTKVR